MALKSDITRTPCSSEGKGSQARTKSWRPICPPSLGSFPVLGFLTGKDFFLQSLGGWGLCFSLDLAISSSPGVLFQIVITLSLSDVLSHSSPVSSAELVPLLPPGKWHQGVNCATRGDHCHHPLSHGFGYFYGMPFTLVNDCQPGRPPEVDAAQRARLERYTQWAAWGILTAAMGRACGLLAIPWRALLGAAGLLLLFFASWFPSFGFVRRWNCILMRNHEVTEQPMDVERATGLLLQEAVAYIER